MKSSLVIKVQHDGTLRRFNASIKKNGELDLDMVALKTKILGLFDLPADADLKLTYDDEDGDVVTLVDDDDLSDVTRQSLTFLRINVVLNNGRGAKPHDRSDGGETKQLEDTPVVLKIGSCCLNKLQQCQCRSAAFNTEGAATSGAVSEPREGCERSKWIVGTFSRSTWMQYLIGFISAFFGTPPPDVDGGKAATQQTETTLTETNSLPDVLTIQEQYLEFRFLWFIFVFLFLLPWVYGPSILTMSPIIIFTALFADILFTI